MGPVGDTRVLSGYVHRTEHAGAQLSDVGIVSMYANICLAKPGHTYIVPTLHTGMVTTGLVLLQKKLLLKHFVI